jgi:enamine deaminase RidA (YjgF/YER057c/UK114 family)
MHERFREGAGFEATAGYARAARHGAWIAVSGTGDVAADSSVGHPGDTYGQTRASFERALDAVERLGGAREDVIRTRLYLTRAADWREAVRAHKELFGGIDPANTTLYVEGFIAPEMVVEVEVDAAVHTDGSSQGPR